MKHDSPSFGETVGFDLDDGTDHREGHARFRSWTRFSWETSVFNGSLSNDFSPIGDLCITLAEVRKSPLPLETFA